MEINEYCQQNEALTESISLNNQYAPSYLSSVGQKTDAFIQNILQCGGSSLFSKEYFLIPKFSIDGVCVVQGVMWPSFVQKVNLERLQSVISDEDNKVLRSDLCIDIDKSVSCSSDFHELKSQFNLDDEATKEIVYLVNEHQVDYEIKDPPLPALMTIVCEVPKHFENIETSRRLLELINYHLNNLSEEEKCNMSTFLFLDSLYEEVDMSEQIGDRIKIEFSNQMFTFIMEEKLTDFVKLYSNTFLGPLYHFALWCVPAKKNWQVILKRTQIKDCFTRSFSPLILKTFRSKVHIMPCKGSPDWKLLQPKWMENNASLHLTGHEEISLNEALALADARKCRVRNSRPFEFVFSGPSKNVLLKRINAGNETTYKVEGEVGHFELQNNAVSRYFNRMHGTMLCAEFAVWYEWCGKEDSDRLYKLYIERLEEIPVSTDKSLVEESPLPEYVIIANKDVMKKRCKCKILNYPYYDWDSYDFRHSKVLLYSYPLKLEDMKEVTVNEMYNKTIQDEGGEVLQVKYNETLFLKRFRTQLMD